MAERVWTVSDALGWTVGYFERGEVSQPRMSAEWLLTAATGLSRVELYAHFDRPLSETERDSFREAVRRRAAGEPLQHVTGEVGFRHIVLKLRPGIFVPRPETELLVEEGLRALGATRARDGERKAVVVDLCAGSGAVGLSMAHEDASVGVWAVDVDPAAACMAAENAARLGLSLRATVLCGDLFDALPAELRGGVDVVLCNPPYVPTPDMSSLPAEVACFEPRLALDGGSDGLDVARRIAEEAPEWLKPGGLLAMELDETRVRDGAALLEGAFEEVFVRRDLAGRERIAGGRRR